MKRVNPYILPVILVALFSTAIVAGTFTSAGNGAWTSPETWGIPSGGTSSTPGNGSGGPDNVTIQPGHSVNCQGSTSNPLGTVTINGTLQGGGTGATVAVNASGNVTVGSSGMVGGCQTGTSNNPVSVTSTGGTVTVGGSVQGNGSGGRVNVSGAGGVTVGGTGWVGSAGSSTAVSSSGGPVNVNAGGVVTAHGHTSVNAGPGQPTNINGIVSSTGGRGRNVYINNRRRPGKNGTAGNVTIGATGVVSSKGEVYINADTLVVEGTIEAKTVKKKANKCILRFPPGSITGKLSYKNDIDTIFTVEEKDDPSVPSEEGDEGSVTGGDHCHIDLSFTPLAFQATTSMTIATGLGGTVDFTGDFPGIPVINCPGPIRIFADNIILEPGVNIEDICGPGPVTVGPSQPFIDVATLCVGDTLGYPGRSGELQFLITNMGTVADSFLVSVVDSLGWLYTVSDPVVYLDHVGPSDTVVTVSFDVPPGAIAGFDSNHFDFTVTSMTDPSVFYTEYGNVMVVDECDLRDVAVDLWEIDNAMQPDTVAITSWVKNTGQVLEDIFSVTLSDREGWELLPPNADYILVVDQDILHLTEVVIPPSALVGDTNEVYVQVHSASCPHVVKTDTVTVVKGSVTAVDDDTPVYNEIEHDCYPNPFNPSVSIRFTVPAPGGHTSVVVYDVQGREVANVFSGKMKMGRFTKSWDGKDAAGEPAASGVYLYRISVGSRSVSGKMVLLR